MDLLHGLPDFRKLALPNLRTRLTCCSRHFFKLFIALIGRFFITDRVRFFFVDGLFLQSSRSGKSWGLRFAHRRQWPIRMLRDSYHLVVFLDKLFTKLSLFAGPCRSYARHLLPAKFAVPVHRS